MPAQDRLGGDQERPPPLTRHHGGERTHERPIRPGEAGPGNLTTQHGQLVAQDEDLGILGDGVHPVDAHPLDDATDEAIEQ